jgi:hypothetical protein
MSFIAAAVAGSAVLGYSASRSASKSAERSAAQIAETGDAANQLGRDQFDWFKAEYASTKPTRDAAEALDLKVAGAQLAGMETATQQAKDLDTRNKTVFQPLEDSIVADAGNFDTAGRRVQAVNEATADVESAFGRAQDDLGRTLARNNVSAGGGRSQSLMQDAALKKATAIAGATTGAVKNVEQQGYARKMDAVGLGKGIVGNQATMQQIAQQGGAQAVAASGAAINASQSGAGLMQTGFSGAQTGLSNAGSLYGQAAKVQSYADQKKMDGINTLGSAAGYLLSDEDKKKGTGKRADTKKALAKVVKTPVDDGWEYDEAKGAPAGSGGTKRTGPMAQRVRKTMGDDVAPGGKAIDLVSMNGNLMAGMQELAKRMAKLEKKVSA